MTATLALSDVWIIGLAVAQMLLNIAIALAIFWLRTNVRRMDSIERQAKASAEQLIEAKLGTIGKELEGCVNVLNERISGIRERLSKGDGDFSALDQRDRELEAKFNLRFDQFKDYLHTNFSTKAELREVKQRLEGLGAQG